MIGVDGVMLICFSQARYFHREKDECFDLLGS
jgi:hypothetical protein